MNSKLIYTHLSCRSQRPRKSLPLAHAETFHKLGNGNIRIPPKDTSDKATGNPAQQLPNADEWAPKGQKKIDPSPQLVDYICSTVTGNPYTGVQGVAGLESTIQREQNMKSRLEGWEKDWDKMSAGKNN